MRVSDLTISNNYINNLNTTKKRLDKLQKEVSTQTKISVPSDSPSGTVKILRYNGRLTQADTYSKNIETSLSFLEQTTAQLNTIQTQTSDLLAKFTELKNATVDSSLNIYAEKVDDAIKTMLDAANSEFDGKYIFGGTDYSQAPYGYNAGGTAIELKVPDVSGEQNVKISANITQKTNMTGDEIFGNLDVFNTLITIRDNLKLGIRPSDAEIKVVQDFNDHILAKSSQAGNIMNQLDSASTLLQQQTLSLQKLISNEQDVDIAKATVDLQDADYHLQLSYKISAMILPKSLLDYL